MPRKPKFRHPLREVRDAIGKSQQQFARMFGVSASYVQAIELGQRPINDELCDDIALRLGVTARSLKQERGMPRALLEEKRIAAITDRETGAAIISELRLRRGTRERLRFQVDRWRKMLPAIEGSIQSQDIVLRKLFLFLKVSVTHQEKKHLSVLRQLDRWIEDQTERFGLRTIVKALAKFDWRPFNEMVLLDLPFVAAQKSGHAARKARPRASTRRSSPA